LKDYNKSIELDPEFSLAYKNRAELKYKLKDLLGACSDWEKAKELGENNTLSEINKYCKNLTYLTEQQSSEDLILLDVSFISLSENEIIDLMQIDLSSLGDDFFNQDEQGLKPSIKIAQVQPFKIGNTTYAFAIININNLNDCNGCSGTNIIGCLELKNDNWILKNKINSNSSPSNSWGEAAEYIKFYICGKSAIGIELQGGQTGSGITENYRCIYIINKDAHIFKAYENISLNDDLGMGGNKNENWDIQFIKSEKEYFDIEEIKYNNKKKIKSRILILNKNLYKYQ